MKYGKKLIASLTALVTISAFAADNTRPWSFWYWMYGAVTKPAIKADLEGMASVGLGGTYLMPIRGVDEKPEYNGQAGQLTPGFWDVVDYSMHIADSLGLKIGVHICDGFALAGGPWFTPEESMQKVVWTDNIITVGKKQKNPIVIAAPVEGYYEDIAAFAIPVDYTETTVNPVAFNASPEVTKDEKGNIRADKPCWFEYDFGSEVAIRNVEITPSGTNFQCQRLAVSVSNDGKTYTHIRQFTPARQGWQNTACGNTFTLPNDVKARYYRFSWTPEGTEPGSEDLDAAKWRPNMRLKSIIFHSDARINHWEGKAGNVWRVAEETPSTDVTDAMCVKMDKIIPLRIERDGTVATPLPVGTWRILRMGHTTTGQTNATAGGGKGLECDKFSVDAVNKLVDNWFAKFAEMPSAKNVLKYLHVDSWECGCQNWSKNFASEFQKRRGYDITPWLPVMTGMPIESAKESERVLRDIRLTINDLINEVFFATVSKRAHEMGMEFSSESVAPTMISDGLDHYRYADLPMGEYWLNSPTHDKPNDMLDAISGAHVYGKNVIQAEGFTEVRGVWDETPASIKTLLDRNLAMGMNKLFFHVNAHNPWMDRKPGMTLDGIGLFFQRDQTWYFESKPFVDYITRCQTLLQQGRPVQDIAVFIGEEMPRRSVLPERLVPMLPGIFGKARVESEARRLANVGEPISESPVGVYHSSGIVDTKDWCNALRGYQYDSFNPDALLNLATAADGRMNLPGGASYRVIVLPGKQLMDPSFNGYSAPVREKIEALRKAGVVVIDKPYTEETFARYDLERDIELPANCAYTHRTTDKGEIYFISNQEETSRTMEVSFRQTSQPKGGVICAARPNPATPEMMEQWRNMMNKSGETPYLYNPADNTLKRIMAVKDGMRTKVSLDIEACGSCFVIFPVDDTPDAMLSVLGEKPRLITEADAIAGEDVITITDFMLQPSEMQLDPKAVSITANGTQWNGVEEMKYFSGHATYTATVKLKKPTGKEVMMLGEVRDIAHVWVNGIDCGIAWTAPYSVNIGHALKKGKNDIRIEVVNTWANALRGNDEGKAPFKGIWTNARYRMKSPYLLPAGLQSPIVVKK